MSRKPSTSLETPIERMQRLGVEFWNDSCRLSELEHAIEQGAAGGTSNPVIVSAAVEAEPGRWESSIDRLLRERPKDGADEIAWALMEEVAKAAAAVLEPRFRKSRGREGLLCAQVDPRLHDDSRRMVAQGRRLAALAPNVAVKIPATQAGLKAMRGLISHRVPVNATVCFTVSQAVACAEAMERALRPARLAVPAYVTIMVGRLDDHLKRLLARDKASIEADACDWAGIAVFKRALEVFRRRKFASRLLVAAYRHERHWTELVGPGIVQSIPYSWWTKFNESDLEPAATLDRPVDPKVVLSLLDAFPDFRRAYEEDGLAPAEFERYGASAHTLEQFIGAYHNVLDVVRRRMSAA